MSEFKYPVPGASGINMACPKCGAEAVPTLDFCPSGNKLIVSCPSCGYEFMEVPAYDSTREKP